MATEIKTTNLIGPKAALINQAVALKKAIAENEKRLKDVRGKLGKMAAGEYTTKAGGRLVITEKSQFHDMDPRAVLDALKKQRKGKYFPSVVKVVVKELQKQLGEEEISDLRLEKAPSQSWSFK